MAESVILGPNGQPLQSSGGPKPKGQPKIHALDAAFNSVAEMENKMYESLASAPSTDFEAGIKSINEKVSRVRAEKTGSFLRQYLAKDYVQEKASMLKAGNVGGAKGMALLGFASDERLDKALQGASESTRNAVKDFRDKAANAEQAWQKQVNEWQLRRDAFTNAKLQDVMTKDGKVNFEGFSSKEREKILSIWNKSQAQNTTSVIGKIRSLLGRNSSFDAEAEFEKIKKRRLKTLDGRVSYAEDKLSRIQALDGDAISSSESLLSNGDRRNLVRDMRKSGGRPSFGGREKSVFGWKGKLGGAATLLAIGGVIGNMFAGGHRSNAELYNPNGYSQYYS